MEQKIKIEINVSTTMRDGVVLRSDIFRPDSSGKYPTLLIRMPYNKTLPRYHNYFDPIRVVKNGYVVVWQDCRGIITSEGEFQPFVSNIEAKDGYDTVEWIAEQPWSNGKVGMYGFSYHGSTQLAAAKEQPPHLVAIAPGMIGAGTRDAFFVGGVLQLEGALLWALHMGLLELEKNPPPPEELERLVEKFFDASDNIDKEAKYMPLKKYPILKETGLSKWYFEWLDHPDYDEYWKQFEWASYEKTMVPAYHVTSWYDFLVSNTIRNYIGIKEKSASGLASKSQRLVIGPWIHHPDLSQMVGEIDFGLASGAAVINLIGIHLRWFDYWLKGIDNGIMNEPPVRIFIMGENVWRDEYEWPLARTKYTKYYFHSDGSANSLKGDGTLSTDAPGDMEYYDTYIYDPRNPVPTKGGKRLTFFHFGGPVDQREVEERSDVLVYTTPPLEEDLEVTGPIRVKLFAASSARDTDFTAKLVDVWPDGKAYNLTEGIIRARYRESETKQILIEPEKVYEYNIDLSDTSNVFKTNHRIRLEVSSSSFPLNDRNTNTGGTFGEDTKIEIATQRVFHDKERPSHIILPVIPR